MMRMRIPPVIRTGYKYYRIQLTEGISDGEDELYGDMDSKTQVIRIDEGLSDEQQRATLLHEALHCMDDVYSIGLTEEQVVRLATGFYMLLLDNPQLLEDAEEF